MNVNNCKKCRESYYSNTKYNGIHFHQVYGLCLKCIHFWMDEKSKEMKENESKIKANERK